MVGNIIEWSVRNVFLVLLGTFFVVAWGVYAVLKTPIDAIPDLSDAQVIIYTEYPGQAPQVVEDQVTYPLTTAMLSVPKSKVVRGLSNFGVSFVYVIFEDGTDIYWARSRVLEYLSFAANRLPENVRPSLGPDATGVGWVYQYVLVAKNRALDELRAIQDWFLRYQLTATHGVSEVASVGGFVKNYQVTVDPRRLQAYGISLKTISDVIASSNRDVGGRVIELTETEYMVRGKGYLRGISDLENLVVKAHEGMPVLLRHVARVELVPDERRGITEFNGEGEVVSGIAVARHGENALNVTHNLEKKDRRNRIWFTGRRFDSACLQPIGIDPSRHRDAKRSIYRTDHNRGAGMRGFSHACAQCAGGDHHASDRCVDRLHCNVSPWY